MTDSYHQVKERPSTGVNNKRHIIVSHEQIGSVPQRMFVFSEEYQKQELSEPPRDQMQYDQDEEEVSRIESMKTRQEKHRESLSTKSNKKSKSKQKKPNKKQVRDQAMNEDIQEENESQVQSLRKQDSRKIYRSVQGPKGIVRNQLKLVHKRTSNTRSDHLHWLNRQAKMEKQSVSKNTTNVCNNKLKSQSMSKQQKPIQQAHAHPLKHQQDSQPTCIKTNNKHHHLAHGLASKHRCSKHQEPQATTPKPSRKIQKNQTVKYAGTRSHKKIASSKTQEQELIDKVIKVIDPQNGTSLGQYPNPLTYSNTILTLPKTRIVLAQRKQFVSYGDIPFRFR